MNGRRSRGVSDTGGGWFLRLAKRCPRDIVVGVVHHMATDIRGPCLSSFALRGTTQVTGGVNTRPDAPIIDAGAIVSSADLTRDLPLAP